MHIIHMSQILMSQISSMNWNKAKNKIQLYAVCKRLTLDLRTYIGYQWKNGKGYSMHIVTKQVTRMAKLISDKIDFKSKTLAGDKEGHYILIKRINLPRIKNTSHTSNVVKSTINALYWNALDLKVYFLLV